MINFYHQVGYSGVVIFILGLAAIFTAIRGVVLIILVKRQETLPGSIIADIVATASKEEESLLQGLISALMQSKIKGVYTSMYFLKLCAAVGPLLGLLGTVIGMVDVFSNLAEKAMPDPSMLAGGIWQALLTTVMGLTLAIPSIIVHYYLLMSLRHLRTKIYFMARNNE